MQSYDYSQRKGVEHITWERFGLLSADLAERLASECLDLVVGVARAGLFPATVVACALRLEYFPVRISRRVEDRVVHKHPAWLVDVPTQVQGKRVAVVDEIADSGETLRLVRARVLEKGAAEVLTACLVSHGWASPQPDHAALVTQALVIFPWDRQVYQEGKWRMHPEYAAALELQARMQAGEA